MAPNTLYKIQNVLVDGSSVGAVSSYTFTNVQANHTISVTFVMMLLYAGLNNTNQVTTVNLSTFLQGSTLTLADSETTPIPMVAPGDGYLYVGCRTSPGKISKISLSTFTEVTALATAAPSITSLAAPGDGFLYYGTFLSAARIGKVSLATFTEVGGSPITLNSGENDAISMAAPGDGFLYVGLSTTPGKVAKINLSTYTEVGSALTFATGNNTVRGLVAPGNGILYAGFNNGAVIQIVLSSFTVGSSVSTGSAAIYALLAPGDGNIYTAGLVAPAVIAKVAISPFALTTTLPLNSGENNALSLTAPGDGFLYVLTAVGVSKVNLSSFTDIAAIAISGLTTGNQATILAA
jgi:hypothetical protein